MRRDITVIGISTWFLKPGRSQNRSQQARGQPGHLLSGHDGHYLAKVLDRFGDDKGAASARTGAARRNLSPCARYGAENQTKRMTTRTRHGPRHSRPFPRQRSNASVPMNGFHSLGD
jgi:hypothetical protein